MQRLNYLVAYQQCQPAALVYCPSCCSDGCHRYRLITERIKTADWIIPPNMKASPELRSLLSRILVPDPRHRATIAEITEHPWFSKGLPRGVMSMNDQCLDLKDQTAGCAAFTHLSIEVP